MNDYRMNGYNSSYPTIIDAPREETASLLAKVLGQSPSRVERQLKRRKD